MSKRKHKKKQKVEPMKDTMQHARERIARRAKQEAWMIKKMEELRQQQIEMNRLAAESGKTEKSE